MDKRKLANKVSSLVRQLKGKIFQPHLHKMQIVLKSRNIILNRRLFKKTADLIVLTKRHMVSKTVREHG